MKPEVKIGLAGRYRLKAIRPDGSERLLADWFENLVTDSGLNRMGTGGSITYAHVGAGSTPAANTNNSLGSYIGSTNALQSQVNGLSESAPWYGYSRYEFRFAAGSATGNISEVGVGWTDNGIGLFSRALVLDGLGAPTTITVLADEALDVSYELRLYAPTADSAFNVTIDGVVYDCIMRACDVNSVIWTGQFIGQYGAQTTPSYGAIFYNDVLGPVTARPSGTQVGLPNAPAPTYANNSKQIDVTFTAGLTEGNLAGGVRSIELQAPYFLGSYQVQFTPAVPKDGTKVFSFTARFSWDRATI